MSAPYDPLAGTLKPGDRIAWEVDGVRHFGYVQSHRPVTGNQWEIVIADQPPANARDTCKCLA